MRLVNHVIKILLLFLFSVNVAAGLFAPILAVFIVENIPGATLSTVGFAAGVFAIAKSVVQIPVARLLDKRINERDDFYVIFIGALLSAVSTFGYLFVTLEWHLYALSVINGISTALIMAAYYAIFSHHTDKGSEAFEWSLYSVGGLTASSALGGVVGGVLADAFGFGITFLIAGVLSLAAAGMLLALYPYMHALRPPRKAEEGAAAR